MFVCVYIHIFAHDKLRSMTLPADRKHQQGVEGPPCFEMTNLSSSATHIWKLFNNQDFKMDGFVIPKRKLKFAHPIHAKKLKNYVWNHWMSDSVSHIWHILHTLQWNTMFGLMELYSRTYRYIYIEYSEYQSLQQNWPNPCKICDVSKCQKQRAVCFFLPRPHCPMCNEVPKQPWPGTTCHRNIAKKNGFGLFTNVAHPDFFLQKNNKKQPL